MAEFVPKWSKQETKSSPRKRPRVKPPDIKRADNKPNEETIKRMDKQAKAAGFMIGVPGQLYTLSLSKISAVYIEQIGGGWQAWRETYQKGQEQAMSTKTIAKANTLDYVLMKAKGYFEYISRNRR